MRAIREQGPFAHEDQSHIRDMRMQPLLTGGQFALNIKLLLYVASNVLAVITLGSVLEDFIYCCRKAFFPIRH